MLYSYKHPYEWRWRRRLLYFDYPNDFLRLPDDSRPFVMVNVETTAGTVQEKVFLNQMQRVGE